MADREKKRGKQKQKNLNILRTKRDFQKKQKTFFIVFEGQSFGEKKKKKIDKKQQTQASSLSLIQKLPVLQYNIKVDPYSMSTVSILQ